MLLPLLMASLSANSTIRSASPYGPIYSTSLVYADASTGAYMTKTKTFVPNSSYMYLRLCSQNISYYVQTGHCTQHTPLPGQCQCLKTTSSGACAQWSPSLSPSTIPPGATFDRYVTTNGYNSSQFTFYFPPFSSTIDVWTAKLPGTNNSFVTRTVGARVQTDYIHVRPGSPPSSTFTVPSICLNTSIAI
jgi:hypothetical protein